MLKKLFIFFTAIFFVISVFPARAQEKDVNVYFFWANGCPHCREEKKFLEKLETEHSNLNILRFEVTDNRENIEILRELGKELDIEISGIPFTAVGEKYLSGWYDEESSGKFLEGLIDDAEKYGCKDIGGDVISSIKTNGEESHASCAPEEENDKSSLPEEIKLPLFGEVEIKNLSLPVLTVVVGILDGFNPCAMWVLLFLISLLLGMKDRKRMWILGSAFIAASGFVYFLFLSAWLNFFLFLGFVFWVRIIIGIVALSSGGYNLHDYWTNKEGACKVTGGEERKKIFDKLRNITQNKQFWMALAGIILLAFAVNLVELICSAGLPAVYTQILTLTDLPAWKYYMYLILYIFFFMLDDLVVFIGAMLTLEAFGINTKYSRFSRLAGGIIMVIIGVLILFKPAWLMFG